MPTHQRKPQTMMQAIQPLRKRLGRPNAKPREVINQLIRMECPGGNDVLDLLEQWRHICRRHGWYDGRGEEPLHILAYRNLMQIADAMEEAIRAKYGMPPKPPTNDVER